jgi:hypothetical protein
MLDQGPVDSPEPSELTATPAEPGFRPAAEGATAAPAGPTVAGVDSLSALQLIPAKDIVCDDFFRRINPPLCGSELEDLTAKLLREGFREPLTVWRQGNVLLDGYNRYRICTAHGIAFGATAVDLPDREAAVAWIITNQLGRRNITRWGVSYLRGLRYLELKRRHGGARVKGSSCHFDDLNTAGLLAEEYGVSERTILRDGKFTKQVDRIAANCGEEAKRWILSRDGKLTRRQVERLADLGPEDQQAFMAYVQKHGEAPLEEEEDGGHWFRLPADPRRLVAKVIAELGPQLAAELPELLRQALAERELARQTRAK